MDPQLTPLSLLLILLTVAGVTIAGMASVIRVMLFTNIKDIKDMVQSLQRLRESDSGRHQDLRNDHITLHGVVELLKKDVQVVTGRVVNIEKTCGIVNNYGRSE